MRNHGLFAFAITTGVLVPAAAHYLTAGRAQVRAFAPPTSTTLELGGAKIEASIEHPLVDPGEAIKIKLTATGAKANKRLAVGLLVYGSSGDEGDRVPSPPVAVEHQTVSLATDAQGNGSKEIAIALRGAKHVPWGNQAFASYQILVMPPKVADRLVALRGGLKFYNQGEGIPSYNKTGERFMSAYGWGHGSGPAEIFDEKVARLTAHTRMINKAIALELPPTAPVDREFTVGVVVKNPTRKRLADLEVALQTPGDVEDRNDTLDAKVSPPRAFELAPNETRRFEFRVTPASTGILGVYARVSCKDCNLDALTSKGSFDAVEIVKTEIVGRK